VVYSFEPRPVREGAIGASTPRGANPAESSVGYFFAVEAMASASPAQAPYRVLHRRPRGFRARGSIRLTIADRYILHQNNVDLNDCFALSFPTFRLLSTTSSIFNCVQITIGGRLRKVSIGTLWCHWHLLNFVNYLFNIILNLNYDRPLTKAFDRICLKSSLLTIAIFNKFIVYQYMIVSFLAQFR
jgi:hypothetical protein